MDESSGRGGEGKGGTARGQGDNSLPDLAARIRAEHEAVSEALAESVRHAIAAGELLIEAKAALAHGQWLPWLREQCSLSERSAQLYMRVARNRAEIEAQMRNGVADLSLNEAAALLMLSSDVRKLMSFWRTAEGLHGEALVEFCIANDVGVMHDPDYNPFHLCSEAEKIEWAVFTMFMSCDLDAGRGGYAPADAWRHVEWVLQKQFRNVDEWLGPTGENWCRSVGWKRPVPEQFATRWAAFRDARRGRTLAQINEETESLYRRFDRDRTAGRLASSRRMRAKQSRS
jgi:hypothetical protein